MGYGVWPSAHTTAADAMLAPPSRPCRTLTDMRNVARASWLYIDTSIGNAGPIEALPRRIRTCRAFLFRVYGAHVSPQTRKGNTGGEQPRLHYSVLLFGTSVLGPSTSIRNMSEQKKPGSSWSCRSTAHRKLYRVLLPMTAD